LIAQIDSGCPNVSGALYPIQFSTFFTFFSKCWGSTLQRQIVEQKTLSFFFAFFRIWWHWLATAASFFCQIDFSARFLFHHGAAFGRTPASPSPCQQQTTPISMKKYE
jgi:hypothetical protein